MDGSDAWWGVARLRQGVYRLYAASLLPPEAGRRAYLLPAADLLGGLHMEEFPFAHAFWAFADCLREDEESGLLAREHDRLFTGMTAPCPPLERAYVPGADAVALTSGLEREYRELGLASQAAATDHVTTQLEMMVFLSEREANAWTSGHAPLVAAALERERLFLEEHVGRWMPTFARRLALRAETAFHQRLGAALEAFVCHDRQLVGTVADALEPLASP